MKKILLLQFRTDASLEHEREMICKMGGFDLSEFEIVNVLDKNPTIPQPKDVDKYRAVITGASGQYNVTDWTSEIRKKIEKVYPFLEALVESQLPTLAICFGHQLVAKMFGGEVEADPEQAETGTMEIHLTDEGRTSPLFTDVPKKFYAVCGHKDSVTRLPKNAKLLAYSDKCRVHAYQLTDNFYSVQFHPELDRDGLTWRLNLFPEYMKGRTIEEVKESYNEIPHAYKVIRNFRKIVEESTSR